jgi:hypothetical protein
MNIPIYQHKYEGSKFSSEYSLSTPINESPRNTVDIISLTTVTEPFNNFLNSTSLHDSENPLYFFLQMIPVASFSLRPSQN